MTRTTPQMTPPSPNFRTTPAALYFTLTDLVCTKSSYMAVLLWNRVSNLESSALRRNHEATAASIVDEVIDSTVVATNKSYQAEMCPNFNFENH
ncbi:hypothetical protein AVEN_64634-1 [Araneus ventricosus]|uniref:Uncharacterized protein n=1 Tax=Araneus ventricosus TaxID=182803 RepID=A0A4Y2RED4_ARAVE|nr:hypothetical protein AVEN_64634-1 [Araneus ventricosus]